ncbi:MAG: efflux RND transporter periplasmic adaptor subunit [Hyphomicrobium aestuarii]|nr:efflux RND transporter periplasmic adaptor subunit [Hyphomicrobium aestuarii]
MKTASTKITSLPVPHSTLPAAGASTPQAKAPPPPTSLHVRAGALLTVMWAWKWALVVAIAGLGAAAYFGPTLVLGPSVAGDTAARGLFIQTVVASGHVEAPFRVNIGSQITGVVADIPVAEGQTVTAGDTLIVLDDREARAAVVQLEGAVAQAEARMRQMQELTEPSAEETRKQAQATLLNAQQTFDRARALVGRGYGTKVSLDDAIKALDIAKGQLRNAELQVHTSSPGGSDYVMAETQLSQARANLVSSQSRLSYTVIKAPRDGLLISRNVERGNVVQPTTVLMTLSPSGEIQLTVQIDEKNLGLIAVGQPALASADAYAKQTFPAEVVYINPGIDLQRASVEVKLRVPNPPHYLRQDMTVSVDIEVARRENAVTLPAGSLRDVGTPRPWLLKVDAGRAKRVPVAVGIVSGGKAEIISGLQADDITVPANNKAIKNGQRVRIAAPARVAAP